MSNVIESNSHVYDYYDEIDIVPLPTEQVIRNDLKSDSTTIDFSVDCRRILLEPSAINFDIFVKNCDDEKIQDEQSIADFWARDNSIVDSQSTLRQKSFLSDEIGFNEYDSSFIKELDSGVTDEIADCDCPCLPEDRGLTNSYILNNNDNKLTSTLGVGSGEIVLDFTKLEYSNHNNDGANVSVDIYDSDMSASFNFESEIKNGTTVVDFANGSNDTLYNLRIEDILQFSNDGKLVIGLDGSYWDNNSNQSYKLVSDDISITSYKDDDGKEHEYFLLSSDSDYMEGFYVVFADIKGAKKLLEKAGTGGSRGELGTDILELDFYDDDFVTYLERDNDGWYFIDSNGDKIRSAYAAQDKFHDLEDAIKMDYKDELKFTECEDWYYSDGYMYTPKNDDIEVEIVIGFNV